jgi:hypothetical protein
MPIDYKEYPANWLSEIRPRILERAGHKCGGVSEHSFRNNRAGDSTRIVLSIAHLDHDKINHEVKDERLQALCQACHLALDMPVHIANRRYGKNHNGSHQLKLDI